jgi:hypothetical protein
MFYTVKVYHGLNVQAELKYVFVRSIRRFIEGLRFSVTICREHHDFS